MNSNDSQPGLTAVGHAEMRKCCADMYDNNFSLVYGDR